MKNKVIFSTYVKIITTIVILLLAFGLYALWGNSDKFTLLAVLTVGLLVFGFYYSPTTIEADERCIRIHRLASPCKALSYNDISDIKILSPTLGALRVCASGGFLGYWGYFKEGDIGEYFGYFGKSSDCFLVKLHDGRQYMLGCENPQMMVEYIKRHLPIA